jgi:hypothetical protein
MTLYTCHSEWIPALFGAGQNEESKKADVSPARGGVSMTNDVSCHIHSSLKSFHSGFVDSISAIFFFLNQPLICFSLTMADVISLVIS